MDFTNDIRQRYEGETFTRLNVTGQTILEREFEKCVFEKCTFLQSSLKRCTFIDCEFRECMLSAVKLDNTRFLETSFRDSKVMGIEWSRAEKARNLACFKCDLRLCGFSFMNLKDLVMKECIANECNFMESDCTKADFEGTDFEKSIFQKTNLEEASFRKAFHYAIDIKNNVLKKTKFSLPEATSLLGGLDIVIED